MIIKGQTDAIHKGIYFPHYQIFNCFLDYYYGTYKLNVK